MAAIVKAAEHGGCVASDCELGLEFMEKMEDILVGYDEGPSENFSKDFASSSRLRRQKFSL